MERRDQILYRDISEQKLWGVSGGLGRYFDIDTNLVRVVFVALTLAGGGGLIAYILLAVLLDPAPSGYYGTLATGNHEIDLDQRGEPPAQPIGGKPEHSRPGTEAVGQKSDL